jgi:hypothetical protein
MTAVLRPQTMAAATSSQRVSCERMSVQRSGRPKCGRYLFVMAALRRLQEERERVRGIEGQRVRGATFVTMAMMRQAAMPNVCTKRPVCELRGTA